ncbi:Peptidoglycan/LPS O-acetylase OafA/YrhL, contains acyltransferase and SGNH-hydrolase domains [Mycobacterium numidiamassiliense]|uniref:Peptidoglycan/LPS O-acetylase OafA/YrhL, contains acyltransferase and SGNH-hydrolase domains n=1 Tax=Mycobacterium numidiamassiliense TaxID=1841861 RepID=A0A2U3PF15_9MYCO|nr:acyltransferase [Mycobacterium numidiamassiliense]SPM42339.1 Peptidoglycan/LPS O-acetylase OafA/YrhL, contains acyltransferase and SGNH-hydrolase domains [Mycobacterium numidiamassiliense]
MAQANSARPVRNLAVDFYRVSGVVLIVLGHWLAGAVTYHDGHFGRENPLVDLPWTQWLTWIFQAVPVFFLAAGYAGAVSWTHRRGADGFSREVWLRHRLARVLGPTAVYIVLVSVVVAVLVACGVPGSVLEYAGWAVAMHLWFLAVYVVVVSLTPIAVAAQTRWGLLVPAVLAIGVVVLDVATIAGHVAYVGWLNYLLCWGALYQLGIAWRGGLLAGRRPVLLAAGSAIALALLIWQGWYPVSMIGVPGQAVQNTTPPTVAMLAFACTQAGLVVTLAPALNRVLRAGFVKRMLFIANNNVMALYLWHMIPVVIVAIVAYPAGLLPQPLEGTAQWWLVRLEWIAILSLVTAVEIALLWWQRRLFAAPLPMLAVPLTARWGEVVMLAGALMAAFSLHMFAYAGFAPDGHLPWVNVLVFTVGVALVALRPTQTSPLTAPVPTIG